MCGICLLLLLGTFSTIWASDIAIFRKAEIPDIPEHTLYNINSDSQGYLWISTSRGLLRYDGHETIPIEKLIPSLSDQSDRPVRTFIITDSLLFFTRGTSLLQVNLTDLSFAVIFSSLEKSDVFFTWFSATQQLMFWHDSLLYHYNPGQSDQGPYIVPNRPNVRIIQVYSMPDNKGVAFLANGKVEFFEFKNKFDGKSEYTLLARTGLPSNSISRTFFERNTLWYKTNDGLYRTTLVQEFRFAPPTKVLSSETGSQYLGKFQHHIALISGGKIQLISEDGQTVKDFRYRLPGRQPNEQVNIQHVVHTFDGRVWARTQQGFFVYDPYSMNFDVVQVSSTTYSNTNPARFVYADKFNRVWLSVADEGLFMLSADKGSITKYLTDNSHFLVNNSALSFLQASDKTIWLGGIELSRFSPGFKQLEYYQPVVDDPSSLCGWVIWDIIESRDKNIWVATNEGLNRYNRYTNNFIRYKHDKTDPASLLHDQVWSLAEDTSGRIWVGTLKGACILNPQTGMFTDLSRKIKNKTNINLFNVKAIYQDKVFHDIWLATEGGGLYRYNIANNTLLNFTTRHGLPSNALWKMVEDTLHTFWITTSNGLCHFDPAGNSVLRNYSVAEGLPSNQFWAHSVSKSQDGTIYLGTLNTIIGFNPSSLKKNPIPPRVVLNKFRIDDIEHWYSPGHPIIVKGKTIVFQLSSIHFSCPDQNKIMVRCEGPLPHSWQEVPSSGELIYQNLPSGKYKLIAKGSNADQVWSNTTTDFDFVVKTKKVIPFIIALVLLLGSIAFYFYRHLIARKGKELAKQIKQKYQKSTFPDDQLNDHAEALRRFMEKSRAFCNQGLSIQELAEQMGMSRHTLSQVLNTRIQKNFYDFVNHYRVEECKRQILDPENKHLKIQVIGENCGFSSKSSFYQVFRKFTGMTPTEFRKLHFTK